MSNAPRTNALDAQVLELLASNRIATVDGNGNMGPKALAFALDLPVATVRASLLRLRNAGRITAEPPHATASALFYEVRS